MNSNISALRAACEEAGLRYDSIHPTGNAVRVWKDGQAHFFCNWTTPLNAQGEAFLCKDKDYTYHLLRDAINMPRSTAYLNPDCDDRYERYLEFRSVSEIAAAVGEAYEFPVVVKPNQGSGGKSVELAGDGRRLEAALRVIFDSSNNFGDYLALVQERIDIETEYRAVYVNQELVLLYRKPAFDFSAGGSAARRWETGAARLIGDREILKSVDEFCRPVFSRVRIGLCGLDIVADSGNELHLLELNSSPGFDHIIRDAGQDAVLPVYAAVLSSL